MSFRSSSALVNPKNARALLNGNDGGLNNDFIDDGENWTKLIPSVWANFMRSGSITKKPYKCLRRIATDNGVWVGAHMPEKTTSAPERAIILAKSIKGGDGMNKYKDNRNSNIV